MKVVKKNLPENVLLLLHNNFTYANQVHIEFAHTGIWKNAFISADSVTSFGCKKKPI